MTSEHPASAEAPGEAYVWVWLPGATEPVVAGRLQRERDRLVFNYGRSYLRRPDAIPIYLPELPLRRGAIPPEPGLRMAGCLRDAAPDAWGRRVILHRAFAGRVRDAEIDAVDELTYLLESGSDRAGAFDFQRSASEYVPRMAGTASLETLLEAADRVERGVPLPPALAEALLHGTSIGGARPKAMIEDRDRKLIAKFSSSADTYSVVKAECLAMRLAAAVDLDAASVQLTQAAGRDVLLVERFDRYRAGDGWGRRAMVSALTLFGLDEMMARYASYEDLAEVIRHRFTEPRRTLHELFGRLVFNVLCGNTDDHARNHAAFWDGAQLSLTPAFDICPQARTGNVASQAMLIVGDRRASTLATCLDAAPQFQLGRAAAEAVIERQIEVMRTEWAAACEQARLTAVERSLFAERMFLNPSIFDGAPARLRRLRAATGL